MWKPCKYLESFSLSEGKGRIRFSVTYFNRSIDAPPWNPFSGAVIIRYCLLFLQALSRQQETILPFFLLWGSVPCWNTWNKLLALKCCCVFLILRFFSSKPRGHRRAAKGLWLLAGTFPPLPQGLGWHSGEGEVRVSGPAGGLAAPRAGWEGGQDGCQRDDIAGSVSDPWWKERTRQMTSGPWAGQRKAAAGALSGYTCKQLWGVTLFLLQLFSFLISWFFTFIFYDKARMLCQHS